MPDFDYDLFVIGAGSGGVRAARIAAAHGARVAIAEEDRIGGTCVIRGCVPKKLLVYASRFADDFEDAKGFGWTVGTPEFDWPKLIAAKDREIGRLEAAYSSTLARYGVTVFPERARVAGANAVALARSDKILSAKIILIATGGRPASDSGLVGAEHAITSNEALQLEKFPSRIAIAGGGYIAVEFASIFNALGSEVTLVYRGNKILRGFDEDLRDVLTAAMKHRGIRVVTNETITAIDKTEDARVARLSGGAKLVVDEVLMAIGRVPNTSHLGLEEAGVALAPSGAVRVDANNRSSVPSIFAVGDVTDRVNLTPVAIREGHAFADSVFGKRPWQVDYNTIPTAVFSTPELATVGLVEGAPGAAKPDIDVYKATFRPMRNILAGRDERTLMKLVVERHSDKVLGVHVAGPDAGEIVQMAAIALRMGATKADFDQTMALHPSAAEELVTLREKWVAPGEAAG